MGTQHADTRTGHSVANETMERLQEHQQAWEAFGAKMVQVIPVLKAQMSGVTQETERAASELMMHLQILTSPREENTSKDKAISLAQVVTAMQFQDITRQKLEHVCVALDQFGLHLQALLKGPGNEEAKHAIAALENIEQKYTMEEERRIHQAALSPGGPDYGEPVPTSVSDVADESVELF